MFGRENFSLSEEQNRFVYKALCGKNILVDACIGSGKTTAIQQLCSLYQPEVKILYLTYNRLLKIDAQAKIRGKNITVTNYHGYAYSILKRNNVRAGVSELVQEFNRRKLPLQHFDVLVLDEYQDIEQELADMLLYIKSTNPQMQIIAVGDMQQKIYDKTALNVEVFIDSFLGTYERMQFTKCFRLNAEHAAMLGRIWDKSIVGVNESCRISVMKQDEVVSFLSKQEPRNILCLGERNGKMTDVLNALEKDYPEKFNKYTVYASIVDDDEGRAVAPSEKNAIFTTYDSSKGLERKICVIFNFTESYWKTRIEQPYRSYEILRNVFCVAASRGKEQIIFVDQDKAWLSEQTLSTRPVDSNTYEDVTDISNMFDFKFKEDIEECFQLLRITQCVMDDTTEIVAESRDGLIDLSPCVGVYQETMFFKKYDIEKYFELYFQLHRHEKFRYGEKEKKWPLGKKILFRAALETKQNRYIDQVIKSFIDEKNKKALVARLGTIFSPDEKVQAFCQWHISDDGRIKGVGFADVVKDDVVYELKFVSELMHTHFLQCASYMVALNLSKGILWNTKKNEMYEIEVPDRGAFRRAVLRAVTKRRMVEAEK